MVFLPRSADLAVSAPVGRSTDHDRVGQISLRGTTLACVVFVALSRPFGGDVESGRDEAAFDRGERVQAQHPTCNSQCPVGWSAGVIGAKSL
jgi:hypothetical protein